jgi:cytochrome c biogenesis protein CcdA
MVEKWGVWGALPLGLLFALAFCPSSAGIYFGSLIPLALARSSSVVMPSLYGIGTAVPVMGFAILIAVSVQSVGKVFRVLTSIERWVRIITGVVLILVGIYLIVRYIAGVDLGF